ncbi:zf-UBP-domain-containing protein [Microthyrium microscopicum]|uniref:Zf-UBP-domain-containing protein n=1 Tax=Microthyrium microscopicum TaxID=703497 RepID=A0A6A6UPS2_9PEZI|nr:zf-UBP-domain-containing protein [Microthyrium microscopicum]
MRSYYFHLAFELSPSRTSKKFGEADSEAFCPSSGTNIFEDPFPAHSTIAWGETFDNNYKRPIHQRHSSDPIAFQKARLPRGEGPGSSYKASLALKSIAKHKNSSVGKDWRFDKVSIVSIDMEQSGNGRPRYGRGKSMSHDQPPEVLPSGVATKASFIPPNPKNTDVGWGVVHLYRDSEETPGLYDGIVESKLAESSQTAQQFDPDGCSTLCILAIPSYMSPSDLLGFVGEHTREDVSHFRLIRTGRANKYMVLMKFRDARKAKEWQKEWNGKSFNSMEPEYCHVVFVQSITFQTTDQPEKPSSYPNMTNDPFSPSSQPSAAASSATADSPIATSLTNKPFAPPTPALVELPTCPVCLERMDETTGLLTILCQHVFHCACLEKWRGTGCPVCRYTQSNSIPGIGRVSSSADDTPSSCSTCGADQNLWICLICGNVGCGRYDSAHAFAHWEETKHSYAMDIATQHVWDYAGDGYVHRLIQNQADGKLLDLPAASKGTKNGEAVMAAYGADMVPREKMEAMGNEYTYLLTSQLDSQRLYFEEQLERAVDKASKAASSAEKANSTVESLVQKLEMLQTSHEETLTQLKSLDKEVERTKKRAEKSDTLARKLGNDWKEEKTVNDSLMERIRFLDTKMADVEQKRQQLEAEKLDLEEQNRDLSFFISSADKLKDAGEDVQEGTMEVGAAPPEPSSTGKRRKGRKK